MTVTILVGNALDQLRALPDCSVHMAATSPPYYGKRDYGLKPVAWGGDEACAHRWGEDLLDRSKRSPGTQNGSLSGDGRYQAEACRFEIKSNFCVDCGSWRGSLGLEPTPELYVDHLVSIFEQVRRVLRPDGTLWLNLGDSYATGAGSVGDHPGGGEQGSAWAGRPNAGATSKAGHRGRKMRASRDGSNAGIHTAMTGFGPMTQPNRMPLPGLKPKDLIGIPWMVAFALRRAGWWLRGDNIWSKPNPMPESTTDRCTTSHEYLFLLAKSERYFYDAVAIAEEATYQPGGTHEDVKQGGFDDKGVIPMPGQAQRAFRAIRETRNKRTVWTLPTAPFPGAHFATFPPALVEPCVKAGTSEYGVCCRCEAPWQRVVRKKFTPQKDVDPGRAVRGAGDQKPMDETSGWDGYPRGTTEVTTLGWYPTCRCAGLQVLPAYPKKPKISSGLDDDVMRREVDRMHRAACVRTDARRLALCRKARNVPAKRAVVLDPFGGAATTAMVADRLQRDSIIIEMNPDYAAMGRARIDADAGLFGRAAE